MTDRIDHAAEARKHIDWAHEQQSVEGCWEDSVRDYALIAQAEATLALAEQQKIANVIALAGLTMDGPLRHLAVQPMGEISVQPTDDIAAALGV